MVRVAKAFDTKITFPVIITTVPPSSIVADMGRRVANYLASREAAEPANVNAEEEIEAGKQTVSDGSGTPANSKYWYIEINKHFKSPNVRFFCEVSDLSSRIVRF